MIWWFKGLKWSAKWNCRKGGRRDVKARQVTWHDLAISFEVLTGLTLAGARHSVEESWGHKAKKMKAAFVALFRILHPSIAGSRDTLRNAFGLIPANSLAIFGGPRLPGLGRRHNLDKTTCQIIAANAWWASQAARLNATVKIKQTRFNEWRVSRKEAKIRTEWKSSMVDHITGKVHDNPEGDRLRITAEIRTLIQANRRQVLHQRAVEARSRRRNVENRGNEEQAAYMRPTLLVKCWRA